MKGLRFANMDRCSQAITALIGIHNFLKEENDEDFEFDETKKDEGDMEEDMSEGFTADIIGIPTNEKLLLKYNF